MNLETHINYSRIPTAQTSQVNCEETMLIKVDKSPHMPLSNPGAWEGAPPPQKKYLRGAEMPFSPPPQKKFSCNDFTEYSVKVVIEAFENKYKFKFYMRKRLYI